MPAHLIEELLRENNLMDVAEKVGDSLYRFRWGSATVVAGSIGEAVVVLAPVFDRLPSSNQEGFFERLLRLNAQMGGMASFAIQGDGAIVLQTGRGIEGLDSNELRLMVGTVGKFADEYDNSLRGEFYS